MDGSPITFDKKYEGLIAWLRGDSYEKEPPPDKPLFVHQAVNEKIILFAAALGFHSGQGPLPLEKKSSRAIGSNIFNNQHDLEYVYTFALAHEKDVNVLSDTDEARAIRIKCFEEYANRGFQQLESLRTEPRNPVELLVDMIMKVRQRKETQDLAQDILDDL